MPDDPKSIRSPTAKSSEPWPGPFYASAFDGCHQASARWLQSMFAVAQEIAQFAQSRVNEGMAAWSTLAACSTPEQALECQRRFAAKASEQYAEEMTKLSRMMLSSFQGASAPRQSSEFGGK